MLQGTVENRPAGEQGAAEEQEVKIKETYSTRETEDDQRFWDKVFLISMKKGAGPASACMDANEALKKRKEARKERLEDEMEQISENVREGLEKGNREAGAL